MKHLIAGTAGHVDHGKTALVKALTGIDCDTHKEEKLRGITINLGFAHLTLPSGDTISIVDVPGHKNFIHTMVAGASGIDLALLVVAADSGVMPQTREHLQIMKVLGIRTGIVVITRIDLAEPDVIDMATEEVNELVRGSFLEGCPMVKVSARTGEGIDLLTKEIARLAEAISDRPQREIFRMYIDRIFSVSGFGTVVTGSVLGGVIRTGNAAYLLPGEKQLRVRRIERHGLETAEAQAGDRASLNLVGLSKEEFSRGMLVSDRPLRTTTLLDAKLQLFEHTRPLHLWSQALFLMGTFEAQARIHLLDRNAINGSEQGLVQIHLPQQCVAQPGDRFVLRNSSSDVSIGGGEIIDAAPLHHRRRPAGLVENLKKLAEGHLPELLAAEVRKRKSGISHLDLADILNVAADEVLDAIAQLASDIHVLSSEKETFLIAANDYHTIAERIEKAITSYHKLNPLEEQGRTAEELIGIVGKAGDAGSLRMLQLILGQLETQQKIKRVGHTWALCSHKVNMPPGFDRILTSIEAFIRQSGMKAPLKAELEALGAKQGFDPRMLNQVLRHLVVQGKIYRVEDTWLHASVVDSCRKKLLSKLAETPTGLTVAQFRDLIEGNRKICLLLYALFDDEGITERQGDMRVITSKNSELGLGV